MINPPVSIVKTFNDAPARMQKVDAILGQEHLNSFSESLAHLLYQAEPEKDTLVGIMPDSKAQAEVVIQIINAATELEMGWNAIRLSNVPAAQRQGRVASAESRGRRPAGEV